MYIWNKYNKSSILKNKDSYKHHVAQDHNECHKLSCQAQRGTFPKCHTLIASSDDSQRADNYYLVLLVNTLFNSSIKHLGKQRFQAMPVGA